MLISIFSQIVNLNKKADDEKTDNSTVVIEMGLNNIKCTEAKFDL